MMIDNNKERLAIQDIVPFTCYKGESQKALTESAAYTRRQPWLDVAELEFVLPREEVEFECLLECRGPGE